MRPCGVRYDRDLRWRGGAIGHHDGAQHHRRALGVAVGRGDHGGDGVSTREPPEPAATPLTNHAMSNATASPSGSSPLPITTARSSVYSGSGPRTATVNVGGALPTTTLAPTGSPHRAPSHGVAAHPTTAPRRAVTGSVVPRPTSTPSSVHATSTCTTSPSGSTGRPGRHVNVEVASPGSGVIVTPDREGAAFPTVRETRSGVPNACPSSGVTVQATSAPRGTPAGSVGP